MKRFCILLLLICSLITSRSQVHPMAIGLETDMLGRPFITTIRTENLSDPFPLTFNNNPSIEENERAVMVTQVLPGQEQSGMNSFFHTYRDTSWKIFYQFNILPERYYNFGVSRYTLQPGTLYLPIGSFNKSNPQYDTLKLKLIPEWAQHVYDEKTPEIIGEFYYLNAQPQAYIVRRKMGEELFTIITKKFEYTEGKLSKTTEIFHEDSMELSGESLPLELYTHTTRFYYDKQNRLTHLIKERGTGKNYSIQDRNKIENTILGLTGKTASDVHVGLKDKFPNILDYVSYYYTNQNLTYSVSCFENYTDIKEYKLVYDEYNRLLKFETYSDGLLANTITLKYQPQTNKIFQRRDVLPASISASSNKPYLDVLQEYHYREDGKISSIDQYDESKTKVLVGSVFAYP